MPWPDYWPKPADHKMHNLGALWSCEVCHACIRVAAKKFPQKLLNPCKGMPRRRVGGFGLLMPTPEPSLLPDRPTPQARVRQNKPKAKAGASLKLGSLFKPSCADPSVCSQGNSSLARFHVAVPRMILVRSFCRLQGEVGWALRSRGQPRPTMGKGKSKGKTKPRQSQHKGAKGKEKGKEKGKDKGQEQDLQKGKAQEKGKGKAPSRVRADPTEEAHFRRLRAHREATTAARSRRKEEGGKGTGKEPVPKSQGKGQEKEEEGPRKPPTPPKARPRVKLQLVEASAASSRKRETSKPAEESEVPPEDQEVAVPSSAKRPKTSIKEEPASSSSFSEETDDEPELTQITITPWHRRMYMQASTRIKEEPREDGLGQILCHPTPNRKKPKDAHHFLGTTIELLKHPVDEDWNPSSLEMLGKGNWRVTYALDEGPPPGRVPKLGDHGEEEAFAKEFPLLTAQVLWSGVVRLAFSAETPFGKEAETVGLIQERVSLAKDWLEIAGSNSRAAYRFLVYVLVVLISLRLKWHQGQGRGGFKPGHYRPLFCNSADLFL